MAAEGSGKEPFLDERSAVQEQVVNDKKDDFCIPIAVLREKLSRPSDSLIFKVPEQLRQVNKSAYEPRLISIGPYHWGESNLKAMEIHKWSYLKTLLDRRDEDNAGRYVEAMRKLEKRARSCYADAFKDMTSQNFVEMLVLDGCFIIELIRKFASHELGVEGDDLFKLNFNRSIVGQELLLVENQLPFFILEELFDMTKTSSEDQTLVEMALKFFSEIVPGPGIRVVNYDTSVSLIRQRRAGYVVCQPVKPKQIKHLMGLVHDNWLPSLEGIKRTSEQPETSDRKWKFIRSAVELSEQGIKFKKVNRDDTTSLFDIKFRKGGFVIPTLNIYHDTERIFRNLIAYEQFTQGPTYIMDYARFMDSLINYGEDVALLSRCGIIVNWLGSDEDVARMFNKLNDYVYLSTTNFYYSEIFNDVNKYCGKRWTLMKVNLRKKHLNSPWRWVLASIAAAFFLLILTTAQTVYTVLSYYKPGS